MASYVISYAHSDGSEAAEGLKAVLEARGHTAWLDTERLKGGANWSLNIEEAIDKCDTLLALMSNESYRSLVCRGVRRSRD